MRKIFIYLVLGVLLSINICNAELLNKINPTTLVNCSSTKQFTSYFGGKSETIFICRDNVIAISYDNEEKLTEIITTHGYYWVKNKYTEILHWINCDCFHKQCTE